MLYTAWGTIIESFNTKYEHFEPPPDAAPAADAITLAQVQQLIDTNIQKYYKADPPSEYLEKVKALSDLKYISGIDSSLTLQTVKLSFDTDISDERKNACLSLINRLRLQLLDFENYPTKDNFTITLMLIMKLLKEIEALPEKTAHKQLIDSCKSFMKNDDIKNNLVPPLDLNIYKKPKIV